jgi:hypothetical protein
MNADNYSDYGAARMQLQLVWAGYGGPIWAEP